MLKKFASGLIFGCGFVLAIILIFNFGSFINFEHKTYKTDNKTNKITLGTPFRELELKAQINLSSVIALVRYEKQANGEIKKIITEILKKTPDTTFYYKVGDEYSSFSKKQNTFYGDGEVMFFIGSPATLKRSVSYHGDRIHGLGGIPVDLFRIKCKNKNM